MITRQPMTRRELACRVLETGGILATMERGVRGSDLADSEMAKIWDRAVRDYALLRPSLAEADTALQEAFRPGWQEHA